MGREVPKPRGAKISTTIRDDGDGMPWRGQKAMRKYQLWTIFLGTNISPPKGTFEDDFECSKGGICLFPGGYLFLFFLLGPRTSENFKPNMGKTMASKFPVIFAEFWAIGFLMK